MSINRPVIETETVRLVGGTLWLPVMRGEEQEAGQVVPLAGCQ